MYKVIIADDNALSIKGLTANIDFVSLGATVASTFSNGMDVLDYLQIHPDTHLLVSDIRMPHMTGLELSGKVLALCPYIKIILISAYDDFEYAQEALRIGVMDYMQKPIQYDLLTEAMRKALRKLEEEKSILTRLDQAVLAMREKFYRDLIHAHPLFAKHMLSNQVNYLGIKTEGGTFLCMAVTWMNSQTQEMSQPWLVRFIAQCDALESWMSNEMECHMIFEQDTMLIILHDNTDKPGDMLNKVLRHCKAFMSQTSQKACELCVGIGSVSDQLWKIPISAELAQQAVNRRFIHLDQSIFLSTDHDGSSLPFLQKQTELQNEIVRCILRNDDEALQSVIARVTDDIILYLRGHLITISYLLVITSGVLGQLRQDSVDLRSAEQLINTLSTRNKKPMTPHDIRKFLDSFFLFVKDALIKSKLSHQQKLVTVVKQYVDTNLGNSQLRLETIAEQIFVSPSHLSRTFKRIEGENISDYIMLKRIYHAQKLLKTTSETIAAISDKVGFASPYYFSACFKKQTGKTPSDFRSGGE